MKHDIIITAQGHKGTYERLTQEFSAISLFSAKDRIISPGVLAFLLYL